MNKQPASLSTDDKVGAECVRGRSEDQFVCLSPSVPSTVTDRVPVVCQLCVGSWPVREGGAGELPGRRGGSTPLPPARRGLPPEAGQGY